MNTAEERYIIDEKGNRTGVILSMEYYKKVLQDLEELDCIRAYDAAKASGDEIIPFQQAIAEIEAERE